MLLIGKRGAYPGACSGKFAIPFGFCIFGLRYVPLGKINFLSNEDTQKLAPGYLHFISSTVYALESGKP
jgi:hypothetical protein